MILFAMARWVTFTAVPWSVNSQTGAVAGPRLVSCCPVVSRASVIRSAVQSSHGAVVPALIAAIACSAEIR